MVDTGVPPGLACRSRPIYQLSQLVCVCVWVWVWVCVGGGMCARTHA